MAVDEKQIAFWGKPETKTEEAKVPESRRGVAKVGASEEQVKIVDPNEDEAEESDDESGDEDEFGSSDEMDADSDSGWETEVESDEDDEGAPPKNNQGKKGPDDSASKPPVRAKKAKIYTPEEAEVRRRFLEGAIWIKPPGSAGKYCKHAITRLDPKKDEEEESDDESDVKSGEEDEFGSSAKMDGESDSDVETESESDDDDEETPPKKVNQGKKSPNDSASKTPVPAKKAKIYTPEEAEVRRRFLEGTIWIKQRAEKHCKHAITRVAQAPLGDVHVKCKRSYSNADAHDTNCAKTALACYNQQNPGAEYELVEAIKSHPIFNKEGIWYHVNFMAEPKSNAASGSSDASRKLFFAELSIIEDFEGLFSTRNRPLLSRCCIVDPNSSEDILGCGHCHPSCGRG